MKTQIGFFDEKEGVKSSTRLKSFIALLFTLVFDILYVLLKYSILMEVAKDKGTVSPGWEFSLLDGFAILITFIFLIASFYPQYLHKLAELGLKLVGKTKLTGAANVESE